jgi:tetratricopeptide (TPR) repeat protein
MSTQSERALNAKNKGNTLFKAGKLDECVFCLPNSLKTSTFIARAAKCYKEATTLDPKSVVYPSNLSAALYELGQYSSCFDTVIAT